MRNIHTVISQIENKIPKDAPSDRPALRLSLDRIYSHALYHAPEAQQQDWVELQATLDTYLGRYSTEQWAFEVWSIFSGVSITEIMRDTANRCK
jgi:hypothetical protein